MSINSKWPHAPNHRFISNGTYMVTGATLNKVCLFNTEKDLDLLHDTLLELAFHYKWKLEAWSVFANHYHFIAKSPEDPSTLKKLITHLHSVTAKEINASHQTPGRKVWFQYWDSQITFLNSYLARLNYVMNNPVRHKITDCAKQYKWCSAAWFELNFPRAFYSTVNNFKIDTISVLDDF